MPGELTPGELPLWDRTSRGAGMTLTRVERWDVRRDGALSEKTLQRKIEALGFVVAARIYPAASVEAASVHEQVCLAGVVRGLVKLTVDGEAAFLTAGDLAFVPRGAVRRLESIGPAAALCFEAFPVGEAVEGGSRRPA